jgi:hypothetical protein
MWSSQYSALNAWSSLGSGAYHALQWTVSKRLSSALTMTLNYTLSKSIDIGSRSESVGAYSGDFMINSWKRPATPRCLALTTPSTRPTPISFINCP